MHMFTLQRGSKSFKGCIDEGALEVSEHISFSPNIGLLTIVAPVHTHIMYFYYL